jgi:hypothetical protein
MKKRKQFWLGIGVILLSYIFVVISSELDQGRPKGSFSNGSMVLLPLSFVTSFAGSYLVVKSKGRSWRYIALALLSVIGHLLIIFAIPDKFKKRKERHAGM